MSSLRISGLDRDTGLPVVLSQNEYGENFISRDETGFDRSGNPITEQYVEPFRTMRPTANRFTVRSIQAPGAATNRAYAVGNAPDEIAYAENVPEAPAYQPYRLSSAAYARANELAGGQTGSNLSDTNLFPLTKKFLANPNNFMADYRLKNRLSRLGPQGRRVMYGLTADDSVAGGRVGDSHFDWEQQDQALANNQPRQVELQRLTNHGGVDRARAESEGRNIDATQRGFLAGAKSGASLGRRSDGGRKYLKVVNKTSNTEMWYDTENREWITDPGTIKMLEEWKTNMEGVSSGVGPRNDGYDVIPQNDRTAYDPLADILGHSAPVGPLANAPTMRTRFDPSKAVKVGMARGQKFYKMPDGMIYDANGNRIQ